MTTREARYILFKINSQAADKLRRALFNVYHQDKKMPTKYIQQFNKITK